MTVDPKNDPGYCGLAPLETGEWDPFWRDGVCPKHDKAFDQKKAGDPKAPTDTEVTGDFIAGATGTFLRGIYSVVAFVPYVVIGGLGGAVRYLLIGPDKDKENDATND